MRKSTIIGFASVAAAAALAAGPSAHAVDTDASFAITGGSLSISAPASTVDLGSVSAGSTTFAPSLGTVTVTDGRANVTATWTATATGTHFDLQGAGADPENEVTHRVANTVVVYSATPTVSSGTGTATPAAGTLATGSTVAFVGTGSNTVTWDPTLTMTLLTTQVAGTYQGTITHSVS